MVIQKSFLSRKRSHCTHKFYLPSLYDKSFFFLVNFFIPPFLVYNLKIQEYEEFIIWNDKAWILCLVISYTLGRQKYAVSRQRIGFLVYVLYKAFQNSCWLLLIITPHQDFLETEVIVTCHPMPLTPTTPTIPATNTPHTQNVKIFL